MERVVKMGSKCSRKGEARQMSREVADGWGVWREKDAASWV